MIGGAADFLKWLSIFSVKGSSSGDIVPPSYGELTILNNFRATQLVQNVWTKPEAGNMTAPPTPPLYTIYQAGNLRDWTFDTVNIRLVFIGATPGYYKVSATFTAFLTAPAAGPTEIYFSVRKNGQNSGALVNTCLQSVDLTQSISSAIAVQASDYFTTGDYLEPVVRNNTNSNLPTVRYMDLMAIAIGNSSIPLGLVGLVDQSANPIVDNTLNQIEGNFNG